MRIRRRILRPVKPCSYIGHCHKKDLGVIFLENLKFDLHISFVVNKANRILGLIKRSFVFMDKSTFLCLYKSLVRSHLDYGDLIWFPVLKKHIRMIENVQRRATRILSTLRHLSYSERLQELNLPTLLYRRRRADLIQVFKIIVSNQHAFVYLVVWVSLILSLECHQCL